MTRLLFEIRWYWLFAVGLPLACASSGSPSSQPVVGAGGATASGGAGAGGGAATGGGGSTGAGGALQSGGASTGGQALTGGTTGSATGGSFTGPTEVPVLDEVIFYDGYASVVDEVLPAGVVRIDNSLITTQLTDEQLELIQAHLKLETRIFARCDNYDRIGSVRLALAEKGAKTYDPATTPRIELARFITPFMDKNREPGVVTYNWTVDHLASILRSEALRAQFDFWLELSVFGVPYAANEEVAGCSGRSDVFAGSVTLHSDSSTETSAVNLLVPVASNESFNDYQVGASDQLGTTQKTLSFSLDKAADAQIVLIISQHGANSGGEEYVRREHFVTLDGAPVLRFRPGRTSCEPYRGANTQANGIYGPSARSDQEWQSFSNWCPGDVIDIRVIEWGAAFAGPHELVIDVPDAEFVEDEGNFPLSVFVIGR